MKISIIRFNNKKNKYDKINDNKNKYDIINDKKNKYDKINDNKNKYDIINDNKNKYDKINVNKDTERLKKSREEVFESILFRTCAVCFALLIIVQVVLTIPAARSRFNLVDASIGAPLTTEEYLYENGQVTLQLIGEQADANIKILLNGDEVASFYNLDMVLNVKDGDVIEIDGSRSSLEYIVKIVGVSSNIDEKCMQAVAKVNSDVQKLVKVHINMEK